MIEINMKIISMWDETGIEIELEIVDKACSEHKNESIELYNIFDSQFSKFCKIIFYFLYFFSWKSQYLKRKG